jgi:hypothetical protein
MDRKTRIVALQGARAEEAESDDFSAGEVLADGVRIWLVQLPAYAGLALLVHAPLSSCCSCRRYPDGSSWPCSASSRWSSRCW